MTTPADPGAIDLEPYKEFPTQVTSKLIAAVEALRARMAELAEALEPFANADDWIGWDDCKGAYITGGLKGLGEPWVRAQNALSATPAKALERAKATTEVIKWAKEMRRESGTFRSRAYEAMEKALDELDDLNY